MHRGNQNGVAVGSPVLATGDSPFTQDVLLAVLSAATVPVWLLSVDSGGHTVDMSLIFGTLTPEGIAAALQAGDAAGAGCFQGEVAGPLVGRVVLPGLAEAIAAPLPELLGRPVEVGPVCAAELPLFFGGDWAG